MGGLVPKQSNGQGEGDESGSYNRGAGEKRGFDPNSEDDDDDEPTVKLGRFDESTSESEAVSDSSNSNDLSPSDDSISSLDSVESLSEESADSSQSELSSIPDPTSPSESEASEASDSDDDDEEAVGGLDIQTNGNLVVINSSPIGDYSSNNGYLEFGGNIVTWQSDRMILVQVRSGGRYLIPNTRCTSFQLTAQGNSLLITMNGIRITVQPGHGVRLDAVTASLSPEGRMEIQLPQ